MGNLFHWGGKIEGLRGFFCLFVFGNTKFYFSNITCKFHVQDTVVSSSCWCVFSNQWYCMYAGAHAKQTKLNSSFSFNFSVKGMLQASGSSGSLCWKGAGPPSVCVCARVCMGMCLEERGNNKFVH